MNKQSTHPLVQPLNQLLLAEDYDKIQRLARCRNWMDYNTLYETQKCNILSWLLCPTEGHGLGEYFIKQLLRAVYQGIDQKQIEKLGYWSIEDALMYSFSNALVTTEVEIGADKSREGRIDLLVSNEINETLIVIERKDGSKLGDNQLQKYENWCEENYPDWTKYYLLLDSYEKKHDAPGRWVQLKDDWLIQGMQNLLNRDQLPRYIEQQLKDLLDYVFADWSENHDPAYKQMSDLLLQFVQQHHAEVDAIQSARINPKGQESVRLVDLEYNKALVWLSPSKRKLLEETDHSALLLFMQHYAFIHAVIDQDLFEKLGKELNEHFLELEVEHFSRKDEQGLYLIHQKHLPNPEVDENASWPYYLKIALKEDLIEDSEETQKLQSLVSIILYVYPGCLEEQLPICEKVRNAYGLKINGRQKPLLEAPFIGKEFLSLDKRGGIKPVIQKFIETVSKIST